MSAEEEEEEEESVGDHSTAIASHTTSQDRGWRGGDEEYGVKEIKSGRGASRTGREPR